MTAYLANSIAQTTHRQRQHASNVIPRSKATWESLNRNANLNGALPRASLVLAISTAQKIFAISSSRDKNSCHNFARLSAWWVCLRRKRIKENLFKAHL